MAEYAHVTGDVEECGDHAARLLHAACVKCGYPLRGLTTYRCPECGTPFNPEQPETMLILQPGLRGAARRMVSRATPLARSAVMLAACVAASWWLHAWHDGQLSLFFWIPAAFLVYRRRWFSAIACLMLTPLAFAFFSSAYDYAQGSRQYVNGRDIIWHERGSIDPATRVRGRHPGCGTRSSNSWVPSLGSQLAVKAMYLLTGPPPGAYTGPYPTFAQAKQALNSGGVIQQMARLEQGRVVAGNTVFNVDPYTFHCHYMLRQASPPPPALQLAPTAAIWKQTCLLVRVPRDVDNGPHADIYAFDMITGEQFAMYHDNLPQPAASTP